MFSKSSHFVKGYDTRWLLTSTISSVLERVINVYLNSLNVLYDFVCTLQVARWVTINEPSTVSVKGYSTGEYAPGVMGSGVNDYIVANNLLHAHAQVYRLYKSKYQSFNGKYLQFRHVLIVYIMCTKYRRNVWVVMRLY